ncbi:MAG: S16 family serine protease [Acidimicrobiales bacterium]
MNRWRIGLVALVVGAGAAVRQRMKTRVDPGTEQVASAPTRGDAWASSAPVIGDPPVAPASHVESVTLGDPVITIPYAEVPPIRLPAMPPAGRRASDPEEAAGLEAIVPTTSLPLETVDTDVSGLSQSATPSAVSDPARHAQLCQDEGEAVPPLPPPDAEAAARSEPQLGATVDTNVIPASNGLLVREPFYSAHRGWSIVGSIVLALVVTGIVLASVVPLPYYSREPGSVYDTIERVEVSGDLASIPEGKIGFVTVSQTANITAWQWLNAKLDNNVGIFHEDEVRGDQTADELREVNIRRMQASKNSAVVVALQKLGFDLIIVPIGVEVAQVFDCTAADGTLGTGDLIVGVNGVDVRSGEELVEQLMGQSIGDEVELRIERIDPKNPTQSMRTDLVAITLGSADADCLPDDVQADEPRPFIGIGTLTIFDEEFPIDIDLRTGNVSGPSAGLAFALAIMDVLSEGELTNGLSIVATGSLDRAGNVGPVGGLQQKTVAAERSGADVFFVPKCCDNFVSRETKEPLDIPSNYVEALVYAEDMIVIGVDTLEEALIALGELGGDVDRFLEESSP